MSQRSFSGTPQVFAGDITLDSATQEHPLGTYAEMPDGRGFRYVLAGGTALVPGKLQQSPVEDTAHQNLTVTAASAIGATTVAVTLGASAVTANEYAEGYLMVTTTPGQGYSYRIKSHPAADASAALTVTLDEPIRVALTTSSVVDLVLNPYSAIVVCPTTLTSSPIGVAVTAVTASQYGWIQTKGPCSVLADGALTVGLEVVASNGTAGAVEVISDGANELLPHVGKALTGVATGEYGAVLLQLD